MTRYYFDIRDDTGTLTDRDGVDLPSLEAAVREARKTLHEMAGDSPGEGNSAVAIDIRDDTRSLMTVLTTTAVVPALRRER